MHIKNERALIIGDSGSSSVAAAIAAAFLKNCDVDLLTTGPAPNVIGVSADRQFKYHFGSPFDLTQLQSVMAECQIVVNVEAACASRNEVGAKAAREALVRRFSIFEAARTLGQLQRVVTVLDVGALSFLANHCDDEGCVSLACVDDHVWLPETLSLFTEGLGRNYFKQFGLPTLTLRAIGLYGLSGIGSDNVGEWIARARRNEPIIVPNGGGLVRSWCHVDDFTEAVILSCKAEGGIGEVFNIGNPRAACSDYELVQRIIRLAGSKSRLASGAVTEGLFLRSHLPSIERARRVFGFEPKIELEEGLLRTLREQRLVAA